VSRPDKFPIRYKKNAARVSAKDNRCVGATADECALCGKSRKKIRSLRQFWGKLLGFHPFNKA
jgi:hypothetical protein